MRSLRDAVAEAVDVYGGTAVEIFALTILLTIAMELWCVDTVRGLLGQKGGKELYVQALLRNVLLQGVVGVPGYIFAASMLRAEHDFTWTQRIVSVTSFFFGHAVQYFFIHRAFHENPRLYKIHRFHHRFNTHVPPTSANAVSVAEYLTAYVMPAIVVASVLPMDEWSMKASIYGLSVTNILVHTPKIEKWSERHVPSWLVSSHDHIEHHRKLNCHYASPTFNIDNLLDAVQNGSTGSP